MRKRKICSPKFEQLESRQLLTVATEFIFDIRPGLRGSAIQEITEFQGDLYFRANDGTHGIELWKSDGTVEGTQLVKDIYTGGKEDSSFPGWFVEYQDQLYFSASTASDGDELWRTDGTTTQQVLEIFPGDGDAFPNTLTVFKNEIYFSAAGSENNQELWKSDGTADGTVLVKDIRPDGNSNPGDFSGFYEFNGNLYFNAEDGTTGVELWRTDGTTSGTELVFDGDREGDSFPFNFFEYRGDLYFEAESFSVSQGSFFSYLHRVDGQTGIAEVAVDLPIDFDQEILIKDDWMYVSALRNDVGYELFRSDGTAAGTTLVFDVHTGVRDSLPRNLVEIENQIYFTAGNSRDPENERLVHNLWVTDGSPLGTKQVTLDRVDPTSNFVPYRGELYFTALNDEFGWELFKTDGSPDGTTLVQDINPAEADSFAKPQIVFEDQLLFTATEPSSGYEIWSWDGTLAEMTDTGFGAGDFTAEPTLFEFLEMGNDLVFLAQNPFEGEELHFIRGSDIVEPSQFPGDANGDGIVAFADFLILSANFGQDNASWEDGDFNNDGMVSFPDFLLLSSNFGKQAPAAAAEVAVVATEAAIESSDGLSTPPFASLAIAIDQLMAAEEDEEFSTL